MADKPTEPERQFEELLAQAHEANKTAGEILAELAQQRTAVENLEARARAAEIAAGQTERAIKALTSETESAKTRAAALLLEIEEARRKADSESGFAYNAKGNAEEHAKAIAQVKGTVDAAFAGLTATKASIDETVQVIASAREKASTSLAGVEEARSKASTGAATVQAAVERVTAAMPAIESGSRDANAITAAKGSAEAASQAIQGLQAQMAEVLAKATADAEGIAKSEAEAKKTAALLAETHETASGATARVKAHEGDLEAKKAAYEELYRKIEEQLPHAASAGLASAFHMQKARFSKPRPWWLGLFVGAVLGLSGAALWGLPPSSDSWDAILRHVVNRLPVVVPLVWLAIYAGHHYSMALRMEEDYAFKEAVSRAFEGYKREMRDIEAQDGETVRPLITLCANVLNALAERPGRIYEGGKADVPGPWSEVASLLKAMRGEKGTGAKT